MGKLDFGVLNNGSKQKDSGTTSVIPRSELDIATVKTALMPFKQKVQQMADQAEALTVNSEVSNAKAVTMAGEARKLSKAIEAVKLENTAKAREYTSQVNSLAKMFTEIAEKIVRTLKKKTEDYAYSEIIKKRKEEADARAATEALQKQLNEQAEKANVAPVVLPVQAVDTGMKSVTRTEGGSSVSVRMVWKGTIVDPAAVPRPYCEPSQKLIDDAVKAGVREIAGVTIEEVAESRLRA